MAVRSSGTGGTQAENGDLMATTRRRILLRAAARGAFAGLAGVLAMTLAEKVEQRSTARPNSYVPGRALLAMTGRGPPERAKPLLWNHAMHWGTGALLGTLRGVWSAAGIRGVQATATHAVVRLAFDQTVENTTGVGAPPSTWRTRERVVDYAHKSVYALVTGVVADAWIRPTAQSGRGRSSR
jgi:hypothetical protein